jgi:hypothetical protein
MKKLFIALCLISLVGCAANPAIYHSTTQNYRPKGEDNQLNINGRLVHKKNLVSDEYAVVFDINAKYSLGFQLDNAGNGSLSCTTDIKGANGTYDCHPHNGKPIGANCIGSTTNGKLTGAQCAFVYNGENAANFKF